MLTLLLVALTQPDLQSRALTKTPIFYISLNRSSAGRARSALVKSTFSSGTRHVERIEGVDGNASARSFVHYEHQFHHLMRKNTESEMGCSLSHVVAIRRAEEYCLAMGIEMAVIMEDDVTGALLPFWTVSLEEFASQLPDNWAVVQLQLIAQQREWEGLMAEWRARPTLTTPQDRRRHRLHEL